MAEQANPEPAGSGINPDTHLTILSVLNFLGAGLLAFAGVAAWWGTRFAGQQGSFWTGMGWIGSMMHEIGLFVLVIMLMMAIPALLAGIGLAARQEWGRILTLVVAAAIGLFSILSMAFVPILYSVYAFWALTRPEVQEALAPEPRRA